MMEDAHDAAVIHEDQQPPGILPSISRILSDHRESSSFPDNEDFISLSQDIQHESQSYYVDTTGVPPTTAELTAAFMCPPTLDEMMIQVRELRLQRTTVMAGFRFRDPTPVATSFPSTTRVNHTHHHLLRLGKEQPRLSQRTCTFPHHLEEEE